MNRRVLWMGLLSVFILPGRAVGQEPSVSAIIKHIVAEQLGVDPSKLTDNATSVDLGADSLDSIEIIGAFEEEVSCAIPGDQAAKILTVGEAIAWVSAYCNI